MLVCPPGQMCPAKITVASEPLISLVTSSWQWQNNFSNCGNSAVQKKKKPTDGGGKDGEEGKCQKTVTQHE